MQKKKDPFAPPYEPELLVAEDTVKEDEQDRGESFVILVSGICLVGWRLFEMGWGDSRVAAWSRATLLWVVL